MTHRRLSSLLVLGLALGASAFALDAKGNSDPSVLPETALAQDGAFMLAPLRPWNIDFSDESCRLSRLFGTEAKPHLVFFEQAAPTDTFGLTFAGAELERFENADDVALGAERDEPFERIERYYHGEVSGIGAAIIIPNIGIGEFADATQEEAATGESGPPLVKAGIDLEEAQTVDRLVLSNDGGVISFETGDMMPPFQALNVCTSDLLRVWGLDPEKHQAYQRPVWTNITSVSKRIAREYPRRALVRQETGVFRMRVIIEDDGTISECYIGASTVNQTLESPACREMRHAKFEPARDAEGLPMRSFYATSISYSLQ